MMGNGSSPISRRFALIASMQPRQTGSRVPVMADEDGTLCGLNEKIWPQRRQGQP